MTNKDYSQGYDDGYDDAKRESVTPGVRVARAISWAAVGVAFLVPSIIGAFGVFG